VSDREADGPNQRLFEELHQIRQDLHALRESFEQKGLTQEFETKINDLEIEERMRQIQDEIVEAGKPKKKKRWFGRR
jgi:hypothetical protein